MSVLSETIFTLLQRLALIIKSEAVGVIKPTVGLEIIEIDYLTRYLVAEHAVSNNAVRVKFIFRCIVKFLVEVLVLRLQLEILTRITKG